MLARGIQFNFLQMLKRLLQWWGSECETGSDSLNLPLGNILKQSFLILLVTQREGSNCLLVGVLEAELMA